MAECEAKWLKTRRVTWRETRDVRHCKYGEWLYKYMERECGGREPTEHWRWRLTNVDQEHWLRCRILLLLLLLTLIRWKAWVLDDCSPLFSCLLILSLRPLMFESVSPLIVSVSLVDMLDLVFLVVRCRMWCCKCCFSVHCWMKRNNQEDYGTVSFQMSQVVRLYPFTQTVIENTAQGWKQLMTSALLMFVCFLT